MSVASRLRQWLGALPTMLVDGVLALLFLGFEIGTLLQYASIASDDPDLLGFSPPELTPALLAYVVALHVPLLWRQRRPLLVLALVSGGTLLGPLAFGLPLAAWGVCAAVYEVALKIDRRTSALSLALVIASLLFAYQFAFGAASSPGEALLGTLQNTAVFVTAWALGYWARVKRLRAVGLEREREEGVRTAVSEERARVARELHDILAHSISVMVVQASGAREVLPPSAERAREALAQIETTGRQSMVEVRRLLGLLRGDGAEPGLAPSAGLDRLDELVGQVCDAGLPVSIEVTGEPQRLDPSVDVSTYRIIQEALTNVLKHAPDARVVVVRLAWSQGQLRVDVHDDGTGGQRGAEAAPVGRGLLGMRERALLVGGSLTAGPRPRRGFAVTATLPVAAPTGAAGATAGQPAAPASATGATAARVDAAAGATAAAGEGP